MDRLKSWQKVGKLLSIIWILGAVVISTKTVGEDRLKFREEWYEKCLISEDKRTIIEKNFKYQNEIIDKCFTQARIESLKAIPDNILLKKVGYWGILPIFIFWLIGLKVIKKVL